MLERPTHASGVASGIAGSSDGVKREANAEKAPDYPVRDTVAEEIEEEPGGNLVGVPMAAGFEWEDRATASAAHAATIPAICTMFPTTIERRPKIFLCGSELDAFISAAAFRGGNSSGISVSPLSLPPTLLLWAAASVQAGSCCGRLPLCSANGSRDTLLNALTLDPR